MTKSKVERIIRPLTADEKARHAQIREQVEQEFPPAEKKRQPVSTGIAAALRQTRKTRGLTYEAVARAAGLPNGNTVKDVEYGRNTELAAVEAIARALGLKLELVEA
jgi:DNA-binding phage protein